MYKPQSTLFPCFGMSWTQLIFTLFHTLSSIKKKKKNSYTIWLIIWYYRYQNSLSWWYVILLELSGVNSWLCSKWTLQITQEPRDSEWATVIWALHYVRMDGLLLSGTWDCSSFLFNNRFFPFAASSATFQAEQLTDLDPGDKRAWSRSSSSMHEKQTSVF